MVLGLHVDEGLLSLSGINLYYEQPPRQVSRIFRNGGSPATMIRTRHLVTLGRSREAAGGTGNPEESGVDQAVSQTGIGGFQGSFLSWSGTCCILSAASSQEAYSRNIRFAFNGSLAFHPLIEIIRGGGFRPGDLQDHFFSLFRRYVSLQK